VDKKEMLMVACLPPKIIVKVL